MRQQALGVRRISLENDRSALGPRTLPLQLPDILAGQVQLAFSPIPTTIQQVTSATSPIEVA
jgi:hypothetical protein